MQGVELFGHGDWIRRLALKRGRGQNSQKDGQDAQGELDA
jgi:hypothetical protein